MITMTDAEALELQGFLNTSKAHIEALAEASAGWQARAEAADATLASCNRARQAAEAECDRLREQVAQAKADGANEERSLHWMSESVEVQRLRKQVATLEAARSEFAKDISAEIEAARNEYKQVIAKLREQVATLEEATCSCCDRPVNRRIDAVICDYCYEDKLQ